MRLLPNSRLPSYICPRQPPEFTLCIQARPGSDAAYGTLVRRTAAASRADRDASRRIPRDRQNSNPSSWLISHPGWLTERAISIFERLPTDIERSANAEAIRHRPRRSNCCVRVLKAARRRAAPGGGMFSQQ